MAQTVEQFVQVERFLLDDRAIIAVIVPAIFVLTVFALGLWLRHVLLRARKIRQDKAKQEEASRGVLVQRLEPYGTSAVPLSSSRRSREIVWVGANGGPWVEELTQSGELGREQEVEVTLTEELRRERGEVAALQRLCTTLELMLGMILLFELVRLLRFPRSRPWWWIWKSPKYTGLRLTAIGVPWRRLFG